MSQHLKSVVPQSVPNKNSEFIEMWKKQVTGTMINYPFTVIMEIDVYCTSIIVFEESMKHCKFIVIVDI